jgi:hypothetical protein
MNEAPNAHLIEALFTVEQFMFSKDFPCVPKDPQLWASWEKFRINLEYKILPHLDYRSQNEHS